MLKIALILGLILFGLIYDLGGVPGQPRLGFWYWVEPGAFGEGYLVQGPVGRFVSCVTESSMVVDGFDRDHTC